MIEPNKEEICSVIKTHLNNCDIVMGKINKIKINIELFKYILNIPTFLCHQAKFRQQVKNKIPELRQSIGDSDEYNNDDIPYVNELATIFNKVDIYLDKLKMRDDYVYYENEPRILITI
jgi:hypothetical protein